MSLAKNTCEKCWLPPEEESSLCRRCRGATPKHEIAKIRFQHAKEDCELFRKKIKDHSFFSPCFPEECVSCMYHLFTDPGISDEWKKFATYHIYIMQTPNQIEQRFKQWLKKSHELTLEVMIQSLFYLHEDAYTSKKIIGLLVEASGKKNWILQELVLRPQNLGFLLANPMILPGPFHEDLWGYFESFEEWWAFWQDCIRAAKRKIKFRSLIWKEELIAMTWHPDRFMTWCLDQEELSDFSWPLTTSSSEESSCRN
jgi:hypothetical protein